MASACSFPNAATPLLQSLTGFVDCQAKGLGENGFRALSGGVILPATLTGCLVIYVALIGYRLVLGQPYTIRDAILATVRAGLVILFCSHWAGYETVFYLTATDGPAELVTSLVQPSGLPVVGAADGAARLESAYNAIRDQRPSVVLPPPAPPGLPLGPPAAAPPVSTNTTMTTSGAIFMALSMGGLLAVRLMTGVLLAIGPLMIILALFDATLGFFEGWVRAVVGAALGAAATSVALAVEVAFVEARVATSSPDTPAFSEPGLLLTALVFGMIGLTGMAFTLRIAAALRLRFASSPWFGGTGARQVEPSLRAAPRSIGIVDEAAPSRARTVADAINRLGQRERATTAGDAIAGMAFAGARTPTIRASEPAAAAAQVGLGQSLRRGLAGRRTLSAAKRDGSS